MNLAQTLSFDGPAQLIYMSKGAGERITIYKNQNHTWLLVNDVLQSAVENQAPYRPAISYFWVMLLPLLHHKVPSSVLELGGGGLSIQRYLSHAYPSISVKSIEKCSETIAAVDNYFPRILNPSIIHQDAFSWVDKAVLNQQQFDWILTDLYMADHALITSNNMSVLNQLHSLVAKGGWLVMNCLTDDVNELHLMGLRLSEVFNNKHYIFAAQQTENHIIMINKLDSFNFPKEIEAHNKAHNIKNR